MITCTCRDSRAELLEDKKQRLAAAASSLGTISRSFLTREVSASKWVCAECCHPIGCHASDNATGADACCSGQNPDAFHALEKGWCISRVLLFMRLDAPAQVLRLATVSHRWRETLTDFGYAKDIMASIFDANNPRLCKREVKGVWLQAAEILKHRGKLDVELADALVAAIKVENAKALAERDRVAAAMVPYEEAWEQSVMYECHDDTYDEFGEGLYAAAREAFEALQLEAGFDFSTVRATPRRILQQRGALHVAFSNLDIDWFADHSAGLRRQLAAAHASHHPGSQRRLSLAQNRIGLRRVHRQHVAGSHRRCC